MSDDTAKSKPPARKCRSCGCTDETRCETGHGACEWVGLLDLCTACDEKELGEPRAPWTSDFVTGWFFGYACHQADTTVRNFLEAFAWYDEGEDADCLPPAPTADDVRRALRGQVYCYVRPMVGVDPADWPVEFEGF